MIVMSKRAMTNVRFEETSRLVNEQTGEVIETLNRKVVQLPSEPVYVKLYLDDLSNVYSLPSGCSPLLYELLKRLGYDGEITISAHVKKTICAKLQIKEQTFSNYLQKFKENDILRTLGRGTFMPNPNLFARGKWPEIIELRSKYRSITMTVKYGKNGREVNTEFEVQQSELDL